MTIQVNGETRNVPDRSTVADLLRHLELVADRVAVEVNLEILDRETFAGRELREGDRIEVLSFIGGGTEELSDRFIRVNGDWGNCSETYHPEPV